MLIGLRLVHAPLCLVQQALNATMDKAALFADLIAGSLNYLQLLQATSCKQEPKQTHAKDGKSAAAASLCLQIAATQSQQKCSAGCTCVASVHQIVNVPYLPKASGQLRKLLLQLAVKNHMEHVLNGWGSQPGVRPATDHLSKVLGCDKVCLQDAEADSRTETL